MKFSTRFDAKLHLLSNLVPLREVPKFGFLPFSHRKRRFRSGFSKKMVSNGEKCDLCVENKLGLVHSATEFYADEAIEALKVGKVIAVPTDTLYGFACDAWVEYSFSAPLNLMVESEKGKWETNVRSEESFHIDFILFFGVNGIFLNVLGQSDLVASMAFSYENRADVGLKITMKKTQTCSSSEAINRIYKIKGRKHTSPLAICVGDVSDIKHFAIADHLPHGLLDSLLPGPVTVILERGESSILEKSLNPGLDSIGVRVPGSDFIRIIARGSGSALALTSANLSGQPSSVSTKDFENLWEHCAYVYDGGVLPAGREGSTVVDLTKSGTYRILRPGSAKEETVAILEKYSLLEEAASG